MLDVSSKSTARPLLQPMTFQVGEGPNPIVFKKVYIHSRIKVKRIRQHVARKTQRYVGAKVVNVQHEDRAGVRNEVESVIEVRLQNGI
jgi:hypothetical protein